MIEDGELKGSAEKLTVDFAEMSEVNGIDPMGEK